MPSGKKDQIVCHKMKDPFFDTVAGFPRTIVVVPIKCVGDFLPPNFLPTGCEGQSGRFHHDNGEKFSD